MTHKALTTALGVVLGVLFGLVPAKAAPSYTYSYAHIRHVEGSVSLQRATEPEPDEADVNFPILPGDRVWTDPHGRAEIEYADGSVLRMDNRTKVDFVDFGEQRGRESLVRHWNGNIILRLGDEYGGSFRIDTPAGSVYPASAGVFRVDVYEGGASVMLSVYEGVAELASEEGSVLVRSGQRSLLEPDRGPETPFGFNTARWDAFQSWSDERDRYYASTDTIEGVPAEVTPYVDDLRQHGEWRTHVTYGHVWYPTVSVGWLPYSYGRWAYTIYGWTWISYDPWGWAPYHYGRWGYDPYGWFWIPGAYWSPAWVSWAIGPTWIGWCPLGYYDRPVAVYDTVFYRGGKAVPRGRAAHGWSFARTDELTHRPVERTRVRAADLRATAREARLLEGGAILDRDLEPRLVGAAAMTRLPRRGLAEIRGSREGMKKGATARAVRRGGRTPSRAEGDVSRRDDSSSTSPNGRPVRRRQTTGGSGSGEVRPTRRGTVLRGGGSPENSRADRARTRSGGRIDRQEGDLKGKEEVNVRRVEPRVIHRPGRDSSFSSSSPGETRRGSGVTRERSSNKGRTLARRPSSRGEPSRQPRRVERTGASERRPPPPRATSRRPTRSLGGASERSPATRKVKPRSTPRRDFFSRGARRPSRVGSRSSPARPRSVKPRGSSRPSSVSRGSSRGSSSSSKSSGSGKAKSTRSRNKK